MYDTLIKLSLLIFIEFHSIDSVSSLKPGMKFDLFNYHGYFS